ncbi:MAG: hypothetical protein GEU80_00835 [Dehalococcoidia bacterium]|nr:hypothetical protein [Dehalococcoidia bacterium]
MFGMPPQDPGHLDPKHVRAAADHDARQDMGMGQDIIHLVQTVFRVITWPLRMLFRLVRR